MKQFVVLLLCCLFVSFNHVEAQDMSLQYGDVVNHTVSDSPDWSFTGNERDLITITVQTLTGQFTLQAQLFSPSGDVMIPDSVTADDVSQTLTYRQGLPVSGQYVIRVTGDVRVETLLEPTYVLILDVDGQRLSAFDENLTPLPEQKASDLPVLESGSSRTDDALGVTIYGGATTTQPDERQQRNRYLVATDTFSISVDNANPINRRLSSLSILANGVGLSTVDGQSQFFSTHNITDLNNTQSITTIQLDNGQTIETDFYRITSLQVIDGLLVLSMVDGQRLLFTGQTFRFVRRGGINGEGQNAESVNVFEWDGNRIETEMLGWHTLSVLEEANRPQLRLLYGTDGRIISDLLTLDIFQQGNSVNPEDGVPVPATAPLNLSVSIDDRDLQLTIDPVMMGDVFILDNTVQITPLNRITSEEPVGSLSSVLVDNGAILWQRLDGSYRSTFLDGINVETPAAIPDFSSSPQDANFAPSGLNNLGLQIFDYKPDITPLEYVQPFNRINGNFYYQSAAISIPSHTLPLEWTLHYNSLAMDNATPSYVRDTTYTAGTQWRHTYQYELDMTLAPLGQLRVILPDGSIHRFTLDTATGGFRSSTLLSWTIRRTDALLSTWQAITADGFVYQFDRVGRLQRIDDASGNTLLFAPISRQVLDGTPYSGGFTVTEPYGRTLTVFTDENGIIKTVRDPESRPITYDHAGQTAQLSGVQYIDIEQVATYDYINGRLSVIEDVVSPYHQSINITYDTAGRVQSYTENPDTIGNALARTQTMTYDDNARQNTELRVVNAVERQTTWVYDAQFEISEVLLPVEGWTVSYEVNGNTRRIAPPTRAYYTYRFNPADRGYLSQLSDPQFGGVDSYTFTYAGLAADRVVLTEISYPTTSGNRRTVFTYDDALRITAKQEIAGTETPPRTTQYEYDTFGRIVTRITQSPAQEDIATRYTYDEFGYLRTVSENNGAQTYSFEYNFVGRLQRVTDADGLTAVFITDDERNLITGIRIGDVWVVQYDYDLRGNLTREAFQDVEINYGYNGLNQLITVTDTIGQITEYRYDEADNVLEVIELGSIERNGQVQDVTYRTMYAYDSMDYLTRVTTPTDLVYTYETTLVTDSSQIWITETNPLGSSISYRYNLLNRLQRVVMQDANGGTTYAYTINYTPAGHVQSIVENHTLTGRELEFTYNGFGNLTNSTIGSLTTDYAYDATGNLVTMTDANQQLTRYDYDSQGRVIAINYADGAVEQFAYDATGNIVTAIDPAGGTTAYTYDVLSRLLTMTAPDETVTRRTYDARGNLSSITDARGNEIRYEYDLANRLTQITDASGNITRYTYDSQDNLIRITPPRNLEIDLTYDAAGNLIAESQPGGGRYLFERDAQDRIISITDPLGRIESFNYNNIDRIGRFTDADGNDTRYTWLPSGRVSSLQDSLGRLYQFNWDDTGRLISINDRALEQNSALNTRFTYNAAGYLTGLVSGTGTTINDANRNRAYAFTYTERGLPREITMPSGGRWLFDYDLAGRLTGLTNPAGILARYEYDAIGNLITYIEAVETPSERIHRYQYDATGNVTQYSAPGGLTSIFEYDSNNNMTRRIDQSSDGQQREYLFTYDSLNNVSGYTQPDGTVYELIYDAAGNVGLVQITAPTGADTEPVSISEQYEYDRLNNLTQIQQSDGEITTTAYSNRNLPIRVTGATGNVWSLRYDSEGRVTSVANPLGGTTTYGYDLANRITQVQYPANLTLAFTYDQLGELDEVIFPPNNDDSDQTTPENRRERISYDFDQAGNLTGVMDSSTQMIELDRDTMERVTTIRQNSSGNIAIVYDAAGYPINVGTDARTYNERGQLTSLVAGNDNFQYTYDEFGDLIGFSSTGSNASYVYDSKGRPVQRTIDGYGTVDMTYDAFDRLTSIMLEGEGASITYNDKGLRREINRTNGITTSYVYDANDRISRIQHLSEAGERLDSFNYTYDIAGNIARIVRGDGWSIEYSYDASQRIINERWLDSNSRIFYSSSLRYDDAGNRIEQVIRDRDLTSTRTRFVYNNNNQLIEEYRNVPLTFEDRMALPGISMMILLLGLGFYKRRKVSITLLALLTVPILIVNAQVEPDLTYAYDAAGNLTTITFITGESVQYSYNAANRLIAVNGNTPQQPLITVSITYDATGQISGITSGDNQYRYLYDAYGLFALENLSTGTTTTYFGLPDGELLWQSSEERHWLLTDGQNSVRRFATDAGDLWQDMLRGYNYTASGEVITPYGEELAYPSINDVHRHYDGRVYDVNASLYLDTLRAYNPRLAMTHQRNPIQFDPVSTLYNITPGSPTLDDLMTFIHEPISQQIQMEIESVLSIDLPDQPDIEFLTSIAEAHEAENRRAITLAQSLRQDVNPSHGYLDETLCTFYHPLHADPTPITDTMVTQSHPLDNLMQPREPLQIIGVIDRLLLSSTQATTVMTDACERGITLPAVNIPSQGQRDLDSVINLLQEIPLFPAMYDINDVNQQPSSGVLALLPSREAQPLERLSQMEADMETIYRMWLYPAREYPSGRDNTPEFIWQTMTSE